MNKALTMYTAAIATLSAPPRTTPTTKQADDAPTTWRPLIDRLRSLLKEIPPDIVADGLVLRELQARLKGRQKQTCHPGELADCLRSLGFERRRGWIDGRSSFAARWYPTKGGAL